MLVPLDLDASPFAAEVVKAIVDAKTIVERVAVVGALPVDGIVARANTPYQVSGRLVHLLREEAPDVAVSLMLDADSVAVGRTGVPSLVPFAHHLGHLTVSRADDIMRRNLRIAILEPTDATCVRAFSIMNYDCAHLFGTRFPITFWRRIPNGRRIVGTAGNAQFRRSEQVVMLDKNRLQVNLIFWESKLLSLFSIN